MIGRIWHGKTFIENARDYLNYMIKTGVNDCLNTKGNNGVIIFENSKEAISNFTFISLWDKNDSIELFSKNKNDKAVLYHEDTKYLIEYDKSVQLEKCYFFIKRNIDNKYFDLDLPPHVTI